MVFLLITQGQKKAPIVRRIDDGDIDDDDDDDEYVDFELPPSDSGESSSRPLKVSLFSCPSS